MAAYADNDKLMIHSFQDSLSGDSLEWYVQLERSHVHTWRNLVEAFLKHYQYNMDMAPNHTQLQNLSQRYNELFQEYAQRWRELASRVQRPILDNELVDMFIGTLQASYLEKMIGKSYACLEFERVFRNIARH